MHSALYEGIVRHRRQGRIEHHFRRRMLMAYLDLNEVARDLRALPLLSRARFAPASFRPHDHLASDIPALAGDIRQFAEKETGRPCMGPLRLLTLLRNWGYYFGPISIYYCYEHEDSAAPHAVVAEVGNMPWRETHRYVLPLAEPQAEVAKDFHVSPFLPMDMTYRWRATPPGKRLAFHLENWRDGEKQFDATLALRRRAWTASGMLGSLVRYPWMSAEVTLGIYRQAWKLWRKGCTYHPHPGKSRAKASTTSASNVTPAEPAL